MPDCSRLVTLLTEYLDDQLPPAVRKELERHLSGCKSCTAFVGTFRSTVALLQSLSDQDLPEELRSRLRAFLDGSSKS